MSDIEFVRQYEPEAQPLYPPAAVCIGVETRFKTSELGFVRGTKHKARCYFTGTRSRVLSAYFWREGEDCSWEGSAQTGVGGCGETDSRERHTWGVDKSMSLYDRISCLR